MAVFNDHCLVSFADPENPSLTLCACEPGWVSWFVAAPRAGSPPRRA